MVRDGDAEVKPVDRKPAESPIVVDHSAGFASNTDLTANGSAQFVPFATGSPNTVARLTDGGTGEGGDVFTNSRVPVGAFNTSFQFEIHDGSTPEADGFTFIIQGNNAKELGPTGGGLGYGPDAVGGPGGIPNSIAIKFDIFSNNGEGSNSTGLFIDGDSATIPTSARHPGPARSVSHQPAQRGRLPGQPVVQRDDAD
jgi:hypothetical protein